MCGRVGTAPAFSSRARSFHRVMGTHYSGRSRMAVSLSLHHTPVRLPRLTLPYASMTLPPPLAHPQAPRHGVTGTQSLHCVGSSPLWSGKCLSRAMPTPRSISLTSPSAPTQRAGLSRAHMQGEPTYAHSSALSHFEAALTAMWACGFAPMHRHTLPPFAPMAVSVSLTHLSLHAEPFYRPQRGRMVAMHEP